MVELAIKQLKRDECEKRIRADLSSRARNSAARHDVGNDLGQASRTCVLGSTVGSVWISPCFCQRAIRPVSSPGAPGIQYMTRCPFSLSRLVKVSDTGQVVYQAEKQACRAFPDPKGNGTQAGVKRNFQILPPLDFLATF